MEVKIKYRQSIRTNEQGKVIIEEVPIGWSVKGETQEEKYVVNTIRNLQFFGFDDTDIVYDGRTEGSKDSSDAGTLHWVQKKYRK